MSPALSNELLLGRRVLVVEDDYQIAADVAEILHAAGAEVVGPVSNVRDALRALDPMPDIATLDVRLRGETSFRIADVLALRRVPFVLVTGDADAIPIDYWGWPICRKPFTPGTILKTLAAVCPQQPTR